MVVFSDAVVAIAITLLALDLPIPGLSVKATNGGFVTPWAYAIWAAGPAAALRIMRSRDRLRIGR